VQAELDNPDGLKNPQFLQLATETLAQHTDKTLYTSLEQLQKISTLLQILNKKAALQTLEPLLQSKNPEDCRLAGYYTKAIYHPRSKPIIIKMYTNPTSFLGLDDTTFSDLQPIHQAKKPVNMVENFPFLDLKAKDLVNCLPLGVYDHITYFQPTKKQYIVSKNKTLTLDQLKQDIVSFLSSLTKKQKGDIVLGYKQEF
jgi:hypothetical protein